MMSSRNVRRRRSQTNMMLPISSAIATHSGGRWGFGFLVLVDVWLWMYLIYSKVLTIILNCYILLFTKWWLRNPGLSISAGKFGFGKAYNVSIEFNNKTILTIERLTVGIEWDIYNYRNFSLKSAVKNLKIRGESVEILFSFTVYWRFKSTSAPTELIPDYERLQQENQGDLLSYVWLQATQGRISIQPVNIPDNYCTIEYRQMMTPAILFKVQCASAVFLPGKDGLTLTGRADKLTCYCRPKINTSRKIDQMLELSCLKLKFVWPKDNTNNYSISCLGTQVQITQDNVKNLISVVDQFIENTIEDVIPTESNSQNDSSQSSSGNDGINSQLSQVEFNTEDLLITVAADGVSEMAALKISACIKSENWIGKSRYRCWLAVQGMCVNSSGAVDPCVILSNELLSASWRCSLVSTHIANRCLILTCESDEILSLLIRPDCFSVFSALLQEYSFIPGSTGRQSATSVANMVFHQYPRTQISFSIGGVNLSVDMDVYEEILLCNLEDVKAQCTRDAENLSCDMTIKDIEIEDRIQNVVAVCRMNTEEVQKRAVHVGIVQDTANKRSESSNAFQQLYCEVGDLEVRVEEVLLLKLLMFCGITDKAQLWGEDDDDNNQTLSRSPSGEDLSSSVDVEDTSLHFERLEVTSIQAVFSSSPDADLSDDLLALKTQLGIPNGLPPCVEKAKLEFERFLRTGIQYRSTDALVRDGRRHYMKEIGRQSAKILGSLHLLGNMTGLRNDIAEGLAELRETGNYIGFVRHVKSGLTESYYKLTDSWSPIVSQSPTKSAAAKPVEEPHVSQDRAAATAMSPGVFSSWASGLGSWIFNSTDEMDDEAMESPEKTYSKPDESFNVTQLTEPITCSTPRRDLMSLRDTMRDPMSCDGSLRDGTRDPMSCDGSLRDGTRDPMSCDGSLRDGESVEYESSENDDMSSVSSVMTTPSGWELVPREIQRRFKGQEFLRRLKISLNDPDVEEKFLCCLRLRHSDPSDKLNALLTTKQVYFMTVGSPTRGHVVLSIKLHQLFRIRHKQIEDQHYVELIKRMPGIERHNLPSPYPEDNPLVRCDTEKLATKAAGKIHKAKKKYEGLAHCPCRALLGPMVSQT